MSITPLECPWAVSITIASTLDFTKASILSKVSLDTPTAAATLNLPNCLYSYLDVALL
jgi:hypothetical protein